uniref:Uncharacterized protein n=1 Tax=Palpitomonas bilix TaxID=652834 RepID=A0A7S3G299_9EUKA|mmetsp:Transcript_22962/g.58241  ORF Transcript_22962/g.58241 Transcript_22962/m.58241 type:complete len:197 (+) Transcript_22962:276-866(+)
MASIKLARMLSKFASPISLSTSSLPWMSTGRVRVSAIPAVYRQMRMQTSVPKFDTFAVVDGLRKAGFDEAQSVAVLQIVRRAMEEVSTFQADTLVTKSELKEKVFNSELKADLQQRHSKEMLKADFERLQSTLQMMEKADFSNLKAELITTEKKVETMFADFRTEMQVIENRLMKFVIGGIGTVAAVLLAYLRLIK